MSITSDIRKIETELKNKHITTDVFDSVKKCLNEYCDELEKIYPQCKSKEDFKNYEKLLRNAEFINRGIAFLDFAYRNPELRSFKFLCEGLYIHTNGLIDFRDKIEEESNEEKPPSVLESTIMTVGKWLEKNWWFIIFCYLGVFGFIGYQIYNY